MYITRKSESFLKAWKVSSYRKPLIMRGARQTGKSRLIEEFGRTHYDHLVTINLEKEPSLKPVFEKEKPIEIIRELEIIKDTPIKPQKTLIFIDEIQAHPAAITKLRYFYEDLPEYHLIAAGSLLEFVLETEHLSFPVGRVDFHYLFPLTFEEFLRGCAKDRLADLLKNIGIKNKISPPINAEIKKLLENYFITGGMPQAVTTFIETGRYKESEEVKESILETYRDDFKKYSKRVNIHNLDFLFRETPKWMGRHINLSKMGDIRSRDAGLALNLLQKAMILYRVERARSASFPLLPHKKTQPKLIFLDLGLAQHINNITKEILQSDSFHSIYKGGFAEQFVGQELLPLNAGHKRPELFYWHRQSKGATAEIDYLIAHKSHLLPVEVKAGRGSTLFSLHQFMLEYKAPLAIRIYDGPLALEKLNTNNFGYHLLSLPLFMICELPRLLEAINV
ncbi:MAG: ATP-binding protein [Elusimicrobia bacterium]|nr:ATP-binding protein [Elusimicrobiota bacterium]